MNPDDPLPELSPIIASYLEPPKEVVTKCEDAANKVKSAYKLVRVEKKKEDKSGQNVFKDAECVAF